MKGKQITVRDAMPDISRLANKLNKLIKQHHDFGTDDNLNRTEIHTIDMIGNGNAKNVTELSELFGVTKGAVSQITGKLYLKGYLDKTRNRDYGKEIILTLTKRGVKAFDRHNEFHYKMDKESSIEMEYITEDEIKVFRGVIEKIETYIDKHLSLSK